MQKLRDSIHHLAQDFAAGVLEAIRVASLQDILGESRAPKRKSMPGASRLASRAAAGSSSKRLARRSSKDIAGVADGIVALVKKHHGGMRAEQIRAQLGIAKKEWMRPLEHALSSRKLTKKGEKRATTYFAR
jgi:hypothetical protein